MAPISGSSHSFQKLKLDTSVPQKPVPSTFASLRRDTHHHGSVQSQSSSARSAGVDHSHAIPIKRDGGRASNGRASYQDSGVAIVSSSSSEADDIETQFRRRGTSISFNHEVTLDSGSRLSMQDPLPKSRTHPRSFDSEESNDQGYLDMHMHQRRRQTPRLNNSKYPLLQTSVDELENDHVASLTSGTTASPLDEVHTPLDTPSEYPLSPLPDSSPIGFPDLEPTGSGRRTPAQRSKSYNVGDGDSILRRGSRRTSTRTGRSLSSMSPAASFLARYKNSDGPLKPTEPDDEGQGIGYDGEYIIGKQIGWGGFSLVKEVTSIEDGRRVVNAVKIVRKQVKDKSELENDQIQTQFDHEVEIWRFLRHPYILPLLRVYTTDFATFCITKLNEGGTLFDLVKNMRKIKQTGLPSKLAKRYIYQIASAMRYLHNDVQVVHRDIKLENCLLDMSGRNAQSEGGDVLLCDFGMADFVVSDQRDSPEPQPVQPISGVGATTAITGSLQYAAPELFSAGTSLFSPAADVWAFGVVIYALLTATLPFNEGLDAKTAVKIQAGEYDIDLVRKSEALQADGADDAIALIKGCFELDSERRWTVHDILECPWLAGCTHIYEDVSRPWLADS